MKKYIYIVLLIPCFVFTQQLQRAENYLSKARKFHDRSERDSAYYYAKKGYDIYKEQSIDTLLYSAAIILAFQEKKYAASLSYFDEAEAIVRKHKFRRKLSDFYFSKATFYYTRFDDKNALLNFFKTDSLLEYYKDNKFLWAITKGDISRILIKSGNEGDTVQLQNASQYIEDGLTICRTYNHIDTSTISLFKVPEAILLERKGDIFRIRKEYKKALQFYRKALQTSLYNKDFLRESSIYSGMANVYEKLKQLDSASVYHKKNLSTIKKAKDLFHIAVANYQLGNFYNEINQYDLAKEQLLKAKEMLYQLPNIRKEYLYDVEKYLAVSYEGSKDYANAYSTLQKAKRILEDIQVTKNIENSVELETKYQNEKKQQEITLLSAQNKLAEQQKANQRNLFLGLLGGILMIIGFLLYGYRNKLKTATKLKELEELKSRFFANISHEFRTPLTLIKSPLQQLQKSETSEENKKKLDLIDQNSNRMLALVDQLLELSKLNPDSFRPVFKKMDIALFLKSMIDPFIFEAKNKDIQFTAHIHDGSCWYDRDIVEKIVSNLLSNALKYTPKKEEIVFLSAFEKDKLHLSVSNSGVDLKTSEVNQLFDRFYQHKESNQGVGIGLALVKELVTLCKGELKTKLYHKVLTIDIYLPASIELLRTIGVISEPSEPKEEIVINRENPGEFPVLLLAEDNADVRLVLKEIFSSDFHIVEAENGEKALQIIQKEMPDIVITDVMMPKMNGFELCRKSKQNEMTSFIPIILLTAKTGDEAHLEGLQSNADAFVTKPFSHEILKLKVNQLLEERKKMRERYSQELILKPKDIFIDSVDEKFIERLQVILDTHLSNAEFSTDQFATEAGMSRMQLHRKLKTLLGFSATEFLRHERLKAAAILLEKGEGTIAEIAYSVGFNDVVYFSKCFKDIYNIPPSKYLIKNK